MNHYWRAGYMTHICYCSRCRQGSVENSAKADAAGKTLAPLNNVMESGFVDKEHAWLIQRRYRRVHLNTSTSVVSVKHA